MAKAIPTEIQRQANEIIEHFNQQKLRGKSKFVPPALHSM